MRLTDIETECGQRLGFDPATDTVTLTRIRAFINETHRELLRRKHFRRFRRRLLTVASIASTPFLAIPQAAVRIFSLQDRTNDMWLTEKDMAYIRQVDPGLRATTANPWLYAIYDLASPVARQPSAAAEMFVVSDAAGDVQNAYIETIRTGGYFKALGPVAVTGIVAKSMGATFTDIISIGKFYLSSAAIGTVTLTQGSGGTELARIPIGKTFARYSLMHLYPTPSASVTYYVDAEVHVEDMAVANDEPLIPEEFHHLLGVGARKKEYEKREKWDAHKHMHDEFEVGINKMITWVNQRGGAMSDTPARHSQLGPWFESGT